MSDNEWERWKATFQKGDRPMPDVVNRARSDRRKAMVGAVLVYAIAAAVLASSAATLHRGSPPADVIEFVVVLLGMGVMLVAVHRAMRGTFTATGAAPLDALAAMERRHAGRLRIMKLVPWMFAFFLVTGLLLGAMRGGITPGAAVTTAAATTFVGVCVGFLYPRMRRRIDRDLREAAEARRLLSEVGDEASEEKG